MASRHRSKSLNPTSAPSLPPPSVQMLLVVFPADCKSHTSRGRRRCLFLNVQHDLQCKSATEQGRRVHQQDSRRGGRSGAPRGLPGGQRRGTWSVLLCDTGHVLSVLPRFKGAQARPEEKGTQPFASAPSLPPSRGGFGSRAWRRGGGVGGVSFSGPFRDTGTIFSVVMTEKAGGCLLSPKEVKVNRNTNKNDFSATTSTPGNATSSFAVPYRLC